MKGFGILRKTLEFSEFNILLWGLRDNADRSTSKGGLMTERKQRRSKGPGTSYTL